MSGAPLRVVVGLRAFFPGKVGGLETYVRELIGAWGRTRRDDEIVVLVNPESAPSFSSPGPWLRFETVENLHDHAAWSRAAAAHAPALYFSPMLVIDPPDLPLPVVVNIPDVQHLFYPQFFDPATLAMRQLHFPLSARRARAVVTLSEHAKQSIVTRLGVEPSRIHPILLAAGEEFHAARAPARAEDFRRRHGLPADFIYFPANFWPHKNHATLFRALALLRRESGDCPHLALSGFAGNRLHEVRETIARHGLTDRVSILGYLERAEVPLAYRAAGMLAFPSLFEGFGLPVAEAMASGCPVIAADATSLPELTGDAALLFDPLDARALAAAIRRLRDEAGLREELVARGLRRSGDLHWTGCAAATWSLLERVRAEIACEPVASVALLPLDEGGRVRVEAIRTPPPDAAIGFAMPGSEPPAAAARAVIAGLDRAGLALLHAPERPDTPPFSIVRLADHDCLPLTSLWLAPPVARELIDWLRDRAGAPSGYEIALFCALRGMAGAAPAAAAGFPAPATALSPREGLRLSHAAFGAPSEEWLNAASGLAGARRAPARLLARLRRGMLYRELTGRWPPGWGRRLRGAFAPRAESGPGADGWVGPRARWPMSRPGDGVLRLRLELSAWPLAEPQQVRFRFAGRELLAARLFHPGRYEWQWPWPGAAEHGLAEIRSARWFVPAEHGISADRRRLSVKVLTGGQ